MSDATGLGVTRRSGGRGPSLSASAGEAGLVFDKLPNSKARNSDKPDIAAGRAAEAPSLSGHGPRVVPLDQNTSWTGHRAQDTHSAPLRSPTATAPCPAPTPLCASQSVLGSPCKH